MLEVDPESRAQALKGSSSVTHRFHRRGKASAQRSRNADGVTDVLNYLHSSGPLKVRPSFGSGLNPICVSLTIRRTLQRLAFRRRVVRAVVAPSARAGDREYEALDWHLHRLG